jgi:acetyl esterase/lipase
VQWIRAHAAEYGVDPTRIGALGGSAGGTLVALLGSVPKGSCASGGRVAAVVSLSGPMDLATLDNTQSACNSPKACKEINYVGIDDFVGCNSPATCPAEKLQAASPISHINHSSSPMYVFNSASEVIPEQQAQSVIQSMRGASVPNTLTIFPGSQHSFNYEDVATAPAIAFLKRWLG